MKKILCLLCVAALGLAACSKNRNNAAGMRGAQAGVYAGSSQNVKDAKYQIIDQEFDNLLAPDTDYENVPAYELQACGESYLQWNRIAAVIKKGLPVPKPKRWLRQLKQRVLNG